MQNFIIILKYDSIQVDYYSEFDDDDDDEDTNTTTFTANHADYYYGGAVYYVDGDTNSGKVM